MANATEREKDGLPETAGELPKTFEEGDSLGIGSIRVEAGEAVSRSAEDRLNTVPSPVKQVQAWMKKRGEPSGEETVRLTNMLDTYFTLTGHDSPGRMDPERIAGDITYALSPEGSRDPGRRIMPVVMDISAEWGALTDPSMAQEESIDISINVGGSTVNVGIGQTSFDRGIELMYFANNSLREADADQVGAIHFDTIEDLWRGLLPQDASAAMHLGIARAHAFGLPVSVGFTFAAPTGARGEANHLSGKLRCDELAPVDDAAYRRFLAEGGDMRKFPPVHETLRAFLRKCAVSLPDDPFANCGNDTIAVLYGHPHEVDQFLREGVPVIGGVAGTGFNEGSVEIDPETGLVIATNYEGGHFVPGGRNEGGGVPFIDAAVADKTGVPWDLESAVSGKILGEVVREAVKRVAGENSNLYRTIAGMNKNNLNEMTFRLAYADRDEELSGPLMALSARERAVLFNIVSRYVNRAHRYTGAASQAISRHLGGNSAMIIEGSLPDKNPLYRDDLRRSGAPLITPPQKRIQLAQNARIAGLAGRNPQNLSSSLLGTMWRAHAEAMLRMRREAR